MATLTISLTGSGVAGLTNNPSKSYTVSDADMTSLLAWAAVAYNPYIQATYNTPPVQGFTPTNQQIMLAWVQSWINGTKNAVQQYQTPAPVAPAPIGIT